MNAGYFATSGVDNGAVHAPSSSAAGGNGVFLYGANGGFPTGSYNGGNYWVDVVYGTTLDSTPPTLIAKGPAAGATDVSLGAAVTAKFSEAVQAASGTFTLTGPGGVSVLAVVSYDAVSQTYTLTPSSPLASTTTYTVSISGVKDLSGNVMAGTQTWTFTTAGAVTQTTTADFGTGTTTGTLVTNVSGGEIQLAPALYDDFTGATLSSAWTTSSWASEGGGPTSITTSGGVLTVSGGEVSAPVTAAGASVQGVVNFGAAPYQNFGLATGLDTAGNYWAMFGTQGTSNTLYARVNVAGSLTDVSIGALPTGFHLYKVQPISGGFQFYVDGTPMATVNAAIPAGTQMNLIASAFGGSPSPALQVDSVQVNAYPSSGTFVSSVINAGVPASWGTLSWTASLPPNTSIVVETRTGNTATPDDGTWSAWSADTNGGVIGSPSGQYIQYRITLVSTDPSATAVLSDITLNWN
jgi:hypothetical protein